MWVQNERTHDSSRRQVDTSRLQTYVSVWGPAGLSDKNNSNRDACWASQPRSSWRVLLAWIVGKCENTSYQGISYLHWIHFDRCTVVIWPFSTEKTRITIHSHYVCCKAFTCIPIRRRVGKNGFHVKNTHNAVILPLAC